MKWLNSIYIYNELLIWFKNNEMVNAIYIYDELKMVYR